MKKITCAMVLIIAASCAMAAEMKPEWKEGDAAHRKQVDPLEGKPMPKLEVSKWMNTPKAPDLTGKIVVLDFWATWCGPCLASVPHNNELQAKYKDKGVVFIGVCHPQGADKMKDVVKTRGIQYPVCVDDGQKTGKACKVDGYPDYFIIGRDGKVVLADCANRSIDEALAAAVGD